MFLFRFVLLALFSTTSEAFRSSNKRLGSSSRRLYELSQNVKRQSSLLDNNNNNNNNPTTVTALQQASSTAPTAGSSESSTSTGEVSQQQKQRFKNFEQVLDTFSSTPLIIYFTTPKCGPCHLMKKEIQTISKLITDEGMKLFSVDTEIYPSVGSRFAVATLPCLVVFHEGEVKLRLEGVNKAEEVVELVRTVQ